jgi:hypothetical protein
MRRSASPSLLADSDTAVLLHNIRERGDPWSWFAGDWPLFNHFYRPVSTLFFELDNRLYGDHAAGYGLTNALLACGCVLALFWFLRELADRPWVAGCGALLFAFWTLDYGARLAPAVQALALVALLVGVLRHGRRFSAYLPAFLVLLFAAAEVVGRETLYGRIVMWLPGRTASVMTLFALVALAAYARYERLGARRPPAPEPSPYDPPKLARGRSEPARRGEWPWALLSVATCLLALGSYEQAVMLPATLLVVALIFRLRGFAPRWGWQAGFWGCLALYLFLRAALLPTEVSGYQAQQLRFGPGVYLSILDYLAPALTQIPAWFAVLGAGPLIFLAGTPYRLALAFAANVWAYVEMRRDLALAAGGLALSVLAYLPMAWLQFFAHYHFWPMAMRSLLVVALLGIGLRLLVSAASPPEFRSPPRPAPAPGSLPRP